MRDIALYYRHIHVRDDAWLKAAALYWPKMARLTPAGYPKYDSHTARKLADELNFFLNINPKQHAPRVANQFCDFVRQNRQALQSRYSVPDDEDPDGPYERDGELLHRAGGTIATLHWIHLDKVTWQLRDELLGSGLGVEVRGNWIAVKPELATVYAAALADVVARDNDLAVVTDEPEVHGTLNGWDVSTLARVLLGEGEEEPSRGRTRSGPCAQQWQSGQ